MRRIMLTFALMLWASQVEADVLFRPDSFTVSVITAVFNDTGTNTFCWQCGDANPLNDFQAVLNFSQVLSGSWSSTASVGYAGLVDLQSTATNYLGLDANFSLLFKVSAWNELGPVIVPAPGSVSFGIIPGRILGVDDGTAVVLECCDGRVDGVDFQQAFFPSTPFIVPPGGLQKLAAIELHFDEQIPSPVPEPTSLLLLGSALAAAALRRRRAKADSIAR